MAANAAEAVRRLVDEHQIGARARGRGGTARKGGLGLGFFIAKTLLERTGAAIVFDNRPWDDAPARIGAWVAVTWPRAAISAKGA